jgi:hypothetical protein
VPDNTIIIPTAIPKSQNLCSSTVTEKLPEYTDLTRIWQLNTVFTVPFVLFTTGVIPIKTHTTA